MFALALEFPDLPLVPDLLGLDIALVRLNLPDLLAELEVARLKVCHPFQHLGLEILLVALDPLELVTQLLGKRAVQPAQLLRGLRFGRIAKNVAHVSFLK